MEETNRTGGETKMEERRYEMKWERKREKEEEELKWRKWNERKKWGNERPFLAHSEWQWESGCMVCNTGNVRIVFYS